MIGGDVADSIREFHVLTYNHQTHRYYFRSQAVLVAAGRKLNEMGDV